MYGKKDIGKKGKGKRGKGKKGMLDLILKKSSYNRNRNTLV